MLASWVDLKGYSQSHPTKATLQDCWEHNESSLYSFGWIGNIKAQNAGLANLQLSPTAPLSATR